MPIGSPRATINTNTLTSRALVFVRAVDGGRHEPGEPVGQSSNQDAASMCCLDSELVMLMIRLLIAICGYFMSSSSISSSVVVAVVVVV